MFCGLTAVRRIGRVGSAYVEKPSMGGVARSVTVAVRVVARRAVCGEFHLARRSHKLPNLGIGNAADCRGRWILRKCAARRRRTSIVVNEINKIL